MNGCLAFSDLLVVYYEELLKALDDQLINYQTTRWLQGNISLLITPF